MERVLKQQKLESGQINVGISVLSLIRIVKHMVLQIEWPPLMPMIQREQVAPHFTMQLGCTMGRLGQAFAKAKSGRMECGHVPALAQVQMRPKLLSQARAGLKNRV